MRTSLGDGGARACADMCTRTPGERTSRQLFGAAAGAQTTRTWACGLSWMAALLLHRDPVLSHIRAANAVMRWLAWVLSVAVLSRFSIGSGGAFGAPMTHAQRCALVCLETWKHCFCRTLLLACAGSLPRRVRKAVGCSLPALTALLVRSVQLVPGALLVEPGQKTVLGLVPVDKNGV